MAVAFFFLGLFLLYQGTQLPMRSLGAPGPGIMPVGLGALLVVLSVWIVIRRGWHESAEFGSLNRVGIMLAGVFVYALVLERLGFVLATSLLMVLLLIIFNDRYRAALAALGVVGTAASFWLFYSVLKVQLPADPWGLWR